MNNDANGKLFSDFANSPAPDNPAFEELVKKYYEPLKSYAYWWFLRDKGEAEDAVQSTFLSLRKYFKTFNPAKTNFKRWIYAICKNECRRIRREKPNFQPLPEGPDGEIADIEDRETKSIPEQVSERLKEVTDKYLKIFDGQKDGNVERRIIELHILDDNSYNEIQEMKLPEFTNPDGTPWSVGELENCYNGAIKKLQRHYKDTKGEQNVFEM